MLSLGFSSGDSQVIYLTCPSYGADAKVRLSLEASLLCLCNETIESGNSVYIVFVSGSPFKFSLLYVRVFAEHFSVKSGPQAFFTLIVCSPFRPSGFLCVPWLTPGKVSFG